MLPKVALSGFSSWPCFLLSDVMLAGKQKYLTKFKFTNSSNYYHKRSFVYLKHSSSSVHDMTYSCYQSFNIDIFNSRNAKTHFSW